MSCEALGDLVIDPELVRFVRDQDRVYKLQEGVALLNELRENRNRMEEFLAAETDLFNHAGFPVSATTHLVQRCRDVIVEGRYTDRSDIAHDLVDLRRYVCAKVSGERLPQGVMARSDVTTNGCGSTGKLRRAEQ